MNTSKVTRFEIIDHTVCIHCNGAGTIRLERCTNCNGQGCPGRKVMVRDTTKQIDIEVQDKGRTLKVFVHERYEEE